MLDRAPVAVDALVYDAVTSARQMGGSEDVSITLDLDANLPLVDADPSRAVEALAALIRHALRTSQSGEVKVTADRAANGREIVIEIEAPSRLIPASNLQRLLLPDGDSTMPRELGGLALGLSLAHSLMILHGGGVEVSDTTHGVLLRGRLPVHQERTT